MISLAKTLCGGLLIHLAMCTLLLNNGSSLNFARILKRNGSLARYETLALIVGGATSVFILPAIAPSICLRDTQVMSNSFNTALGGVFIGWGTRNADGSLFEHLFVGLPLLSKTSLVVVITALGSELIFTKAVSLLELDTPSLSFLLLPPHASLSLPGSTISLLTAITISCFILSLSVHYGFRTTSSIRLSVAFVSGLEYACGLLVSGLITSKRQGSFTWNGIDLTLLVVAVTGTLPSLARIQLRELASPPEYDEEFHLESFQIDVEAWLKVVIGSIILGVGWGWDSLAAETFLIRVVNDPPGGLLGMAGFLIGISYA